VRTALDTRRCFARVVILLYGWGWDSSSALPIGQACSSQVK